MSAVATGAEVGTALTPLLALDDVQVARGGRTVLGSLRFAVAHGEWIAVVGPNGAGKTTLLHALAGVIAHSGSPHGELAAPTRGRRRPDRSTRRRARAVALVPQHPVVPEAMTVRDYVLLGRTPHLGTFSAPGRHDRAVADALLHRLDLSTRAGRRMHTLSGGERQRACIARALAQEPQLLLLDEPTTGLDIGHQLDVLDLIDGLRAEHGLTVVATLHDLTVAAQYASRLMLLDGGIVAADGSPREVLTDDRIHAHYGARVQVCEVSGTTVVVPVRAPR